MHRFRTALLYADQSIDNVFERQVPLLYPIMHTLRDLTTCAGRVGQLPHSQPHLDRRTAEWSKQHLDLGQANRLRCAVGRRRIQSITLLM
jgi:hypothetical protein